MSPIGGRLTSDLTLLSVGGATGYCIVLTDAATIETNALLAGEYHQNTFRVSCAVDRILGNPTNAKCGQVLKHCIINTSGSEIVITLDSKFRVGKAFPEPPGGLNITTTEGFDGPYSAQIN